MTLSAATLPDYHLAPAGATPSAITHTARVAEVNRRSVLRLAIGGALGIGLATLDLVTRAMPGKANNPNPILSIWDTCRGYFDPGTICVPNTAWFGSGTPGVCNGSWHRNDKYYGSSVSYDFTFNNTSCDTRNAWRWASGTRRKCSDGHTYYRDGGTYRNTFSICRTAI